MERSEVFFDPWLTIHPLATLASFAGPASSQVLDTKFWVTNAEVYAMVLSGGIAYLGGQFTHVGPLTGGFVAINNATGAPLGPFPYVRGYVKAIADSLEF